MLTLQPRFESLSDPMIKCVDGITGLAGTCTWFALQVMMETAIICMCAKYGAQKHGHWGGKPGIGLKVFLKVLGG